MADETEQTSALQRVRAYVDALPTMYDDDPEGMPEGLVIDSCHLWGEPHGRFNSIDHGTHELTLADLLAVVKIAEAGRTEEAYEEASSDVEHYRDLAEAAEVAAVAERRHRDLLLHDPVSPHGPPYWCSMHDEAHPSCYWKREEQLQQLGLSEGEPR